ncbi:MAG: hypothetical protein ACRCXL_10915 [Dermatophilaceae bacterium]
MTVPLVAQSVVLTRAQARSTPLPDGETLAAFAATGRPSSSILRSPAPAS